MARPALAEAPPSSLEAARLIAAIEESLGSPGDLVRPPETRIPPGTYALCKLDPALIYRNMVGGSAIPWQEAQILYGGWKEYFGAVSAALAGTARAPSRSNLAIRAKLDGDIRLQIGEYGISEPSSAAMKHYQALLWSGSCLIDRANSEFVRAYLASRKWPSKGDPADPDGPSHSLFLLLQHSVLSAAETERLVPWVEAAFSRRSISPFDYARIVDRANQSLRGFQDFGTQISVLNGRRVIEGATGCRAVLNEKRRELGLAPIDPEIEVRLRGGGSCEEAQ